MCIIIHISIHFKGTVSVISGDPPCKDGKVRFTTVPFKPLSDQYNGRYYGRNACGKIIRFQNYEHFYLICNCSDKDIKSTVVNRALPSFHGGSLETTLTIPLILNYIFTPWAIDGPCNLFLYPAWGRGLNSTRPNFLQVFVSLVSCSTRLLKYKRWLYKWLNYAYHYFFA